MEARLKELERIFGEKILLYSNLLECLKREQEYLIEVDMERLWVVSEEKQEIISNIHKIDSRIDTILLEIFPEVKEESRRIPMSEVIPRLPDRYQKRLKSLNLTLFLLEKEVKSLGRENMLFIEDSLQFLDQILAILTQGKDSNQIYNKRDLLSKEPQYNLLLSRKV